MNAAVCLYAWKHGDSHRVRSSDDSDRSSARRCGVITERGQFKNAHWISSLFPFNRCSPRCRSCHILDQLALFWPSDRKKVRNPPLKPRLDLLEKKPARIFTSKWFISHRHAMGRKKVKNWPIKPRPKNLQKIYKKSTKNLQKNLLVQPRSKFMRKKQQISLCSCTCAIISKKRKKLAVILCRLSQLAFGAQTIAHFAIGRRGGGGKYRLIVGRKKNFTVCFRMVDWLIDWFLRLTWNKRNSRQTLLWRYYCIVEQIQTLGRAVSRPLLALVGPLELSAFFICFMAQYWISFQRQKCLWLKLDIFH